MIYENLTVRLGDWGVGLTIIPDVIAFRQNGPLVIQQGRLTRVLIIILLMTGVIPLSMFPRRCGQEEA